MTGVLANGRDARRTASKSWNTYCPKQYGCAYDSPDSSTNSNAYESYTFSWNLIPFCPHSSRNIPRNYNPVIVVNDKGICHIHDEAPMVTYWFPNFLRTSLLFVSKQSRFLFTYLVATITCFALSRRTRGESAALGHFSVSIFFWQADNKESRNKFSSIAV